MFASTDTMVSQPANGSVSYAERHFSMTALVNQTLPHRLTLPSRFSGAWRENPPLMICGLLLLVVLAATIVGLIVDPRQVLNEPVWMKPAKFAISISIYSFSLLWLMSHIMRGRWLVTLVSWVVLTVFVIEEAIISYQAFRGVRSHFNLTTEFDATLFSVMGGAIGLLWVSNLAIAILLLVQRFRNPILAWALRFSLIVALVGMAVAFFMPQPSPSQEAQLEATGQSQFIGAHSVGVDDGGPGLPIVGWSTVGGDLRVPHFVGIHALQALPLVAWLLMALPAAWLTVRDRSRLMIVAGVGGLGVVILLLWQALRGQSVIAPDATTLLAAGGGLVALGVAALAVVLNARRRTSSAYA
jgi:hypothetical protein